MSFSLDRRALLISAAAAGLGSGAAHASPFRFAQIEEAIGGRVGVYAKRDGDARVLSNRPGERFAMCSTFKAPLAAFVLDEIDNGGLAPDEPISITDTDLIGYSPEVEPRRQAGIGFMSITGLCRVVVTKSDNTAANLLLERLGGPKGFTQRVRRFEGTTRLDRYEPELNENALGDPRDTTTPEGMVKLLDRLLFQSGFSQRAAEQTRAMMIDCATGGSRLRAGLPADLIIGDKTGTSLNGLSADIGFVETGDGRAPIVMASYVDALNLPASTANEVHKQVGQIIAETFLRGN